MDADVAADVDPLPRARDPLEQRLHELRIGADEREHGAVVVRVRVDVEQPGARTEGRRERRDRLGSRPSETFGTDSSGKGMRPNVGTMTGRRSTYRSLASLQRDNAGCRAAPRPASRSSPLPVLEGRPGQRAYLFGQAPGVVEGAEGRPWRGRAGQTLRRWLELDEDDFYATFYCASVTRCYPGRAQSGRGDRTPTPREQELCAFWQEWELRLLRPSLIVTVGGLALRRLLGEPSLTDCVGTRFELAGRPSCRSPTPPARAAGSTCPRTARGWPRRSTWLTLS